MTRAEAIADPAILKRDLLVTKVAEIQETDLEIIGKVLLRQGRRQIP
jgi:hypothetical protein